ncbi:hypothetical protein JCM5353_006869 [Sporobolomyces roseus]
MTRKQSRLRAKQKFAEDEPHAAQLLDQLTSYIHGMSPSDCKETPHPGLISETVSDYIRRNQSSFGTIFRTVPTVEDLVPGVDNKDPQRDIFIPEPIPLHAASTPATEVVDVPGKGKGIVALRDLEEGDLLFSEKPVVVVDRNLQLSVPEMVSYLDRQVSSLSEEDSKAFNQLAIAPPAKSEATSYGIAMTNGISIETGPSEGGVFLLASRLNHSCRPSVAWRWDSKEEKLRVQLVRSVKKGEELTVSYTPAMEQSGPRRATLQRRYGFDCDCEVCSSPAELAASDYRRQLLADITNGLNNGPSPDHIPSLLHIVCLDGLKLFEEEGLHFVRDSLDLAYAAFMVSVIFGYRKIAEIWIDRLLKLEKRAVGVWSPRFKFFTILKKDVTCHSHWNTIEKMNSARGLR